MNSSRDYFAGDVGKSAGNRRLQLDHEKEKIEFDLISPQEWKKTAEKSSGLPEVKGYVREKNRVYTNREYGTLHLKKEAEEFPVDLLGKKPRFSSIYGYIKVSDQEYVAVVRDRKALYFWLFSAVIVVLCCIVFLLQQERNKPLQPIDTLPQPSESEAEEQETEKLTVDVVLPDGDISVGKLRRMTGGDQTSEKPYSGELHITVMQSDDAGEHMLLDSDATAAEGLISGLCVDFLSLDYELVAGVYSGMSTVTFPDGTTEELPTSIIIRQSMGGTVEISYSDHVTVNLKDQAVSLEYKQGPSSNKTRIQVILTDNGEEYILAESEVLGDGKTVKNLQLEQSLEKKLQQGVYKGVIRILFLDNDSGAVSFNSDIDAEIIVSSANQA